MDSGFWPKSANSMEKGESYEENYEILLDRVFSIVDIAKIDLNFTVYCIWIVNNGVNYTV